MLVCAVHIGQPREGATAAAEMAELLVGSEGQIISAGPVDRQYRPHTEMTEIVRAVNQQVYPLADHPRPAAPD